jgi:hypothetical protein
VSWRLSPVAVDETPCRRVPGLLARRRKVNLTFPCHSDGELVGCREPPVLVVRRLASGSSECANKHSSLSQQTCLFFPFWSSGGGFDIRPITPSFSSYGKQNLAP